MGRQRKIIHIDMDCFYAAIEVRDNPQLKGKPIAVGGPANSRGVLCTCNYEARQYGVRSAMPSSHAARLCPELIIVPVNFDKYRQVSREVQSLFRHYTDLVEPLSLDEAYLDVSHTSLHQGSATRIAAEIRQAIYDSQQLTASAGIAPNKMLAKIASDWNKPNGQYVITPPMIDEFIKALPVKKLFGVGKVTAEKLHAHNIHTCSDIQNYAENEFILMFGRWGKQLYQMAHGIDHRKVITEWKRKSLSVEHTFQQDYAITDINEELLAKLYEELKRRLDKAQKNLTEIKTLFIKIKYNDFTSTTAQTPLEHFSSHAFQALFQNKTQNETRPIRLLGMGVYFHQDEITQTEQQLTFAF